MRAEWMRPVDDLILEFLRDESLSTPEVISEEIGRNRNYVTQRCSELYEYGLVTKIARGVYKLTENGEAYLDEELDANELEANEN